MGPDDRGNGFGSVFLHWVYVIVKMDMFILFNFNPQRLDLGNIIFMSIKHHIKHFC